MISNTKQELLDNTLLRFKTAKDRAGYISSTGGFVCKYRDDNGKKCAIGHEISDELANKIEGIALSHTFHELPTRLTDMGFKFISAIQRLHDTDSNWTDQGLTPRGLEAIEHIKSFITC